MSFAAIRAAAAMFSWHAMTAGVLGLVALVLMITGLTHFKWVLQTSLQTDCSEPADYFSCKKRDLPEAKDLCVCRAEFQEARESIEDDTDCKDSNKDTCDRLDTHITAGLGMIIPGALGLTTLAGAIVFSFMTSLLNQRWSRPAIACYLASLLLFFLGLVIWGSLTSGKKEAGPHCIDKDGDKFECPLGYSSILAIVSLCLAFISTILQSLPIPGIDKF
ncbi:unnamed protein product [Vitrella brassicaformis CCMP3155]|uniref:Uncharacterized protein n=1 Tax=Vitrella brassicaformis (strain CCMP3155) TaxID=1169540 RepID=A0A0G4EPB4_VITBC|nr:unnamed protein product [Vitrella brassicaformis CCMP3155]|eukprot:CEL99460.1 unnamed protein product [Vitrella brassicaformis CCMP3155]